MLKYFISFTAMKKGHLSQVLTTGNTDLTTGSPITGPARIREIEAVIAKQFGYDNVIILSGQRFEDETPSKD